SGSRFPDWKNGSAFQRTEVGIRCSVQASHSTHGKGRTLKGGAWRVPKRVGVSKVAHLLICSGMASRMTVAYIKVPARCCRICGSVPVLRHTRKVGLRKRFGIARSETTARLG